eukprot:jgi/Mesvir1/20501/Mv12387-RA.1
MAVWGDSRIDSSLLNARAGSIRLEEHWKDRNTTREQSNHHGDRHISFSARSQADGRDDGGNKLETRGEHADGEFLQNEAWARRAPGAVRQEAAETSEARITAGQSAPGRPSEARTEIAKEDPRSQVSDLASVMQHSWDSIGQVIRRLDDDLDHCSKLLASATAPTVSMATRKKLLEKSLDEAERGRTHMQALSNHLSDLQYMSMEMSMRHETAMEERDAMVRQVERMAADMEELSGRLSLAHRSDDGKSGAIANLLARAEASESRAQSLAQALRACEAALSAARSDVEATSKANAELRESNAALWQQAQEAGRVAEEERERARTCQLASSDAQQTIERQKAALAKVTGDNMVFIIKLNAATEELEARNTEVAQLQAQIDSRCGDWIRRAREQVAATMQGSLEKVDELEKTVAREKELRAVLEERVAQAEAARAAVEGERVDLQAQLAALEDRLATAMRAQEAAEAKSQEQMRQADHARAEVLVLSETLAAARVELVHLSMKLENSGAELKAARDQLAATHDDLVAATASIRAAEEATRQERRVNAVLMRKKEEVEWELLALQAATGQAALAQAPASIAKGRGVSTPTTTTGDLRAEVPPRLAQSTPPLSSGPPAHHRGAAVMATGGPSSAARDSSAAPAAVMPAGDVPREVPGERGGADASKMRGRLDTASEMEAAALPRVSPRDGPTSSQGSDVPHDEEDGSGTELPASWVDSSTFWHGEAMGDREAVGGPGYPVGMVSNRSWMVASTDIRKNKCL